MRSNKKIKESAQDSSPGPRFTERGGKVYDSGRELSSEEAEKAQKLLSVRKKKLQESSPRKALDGLDDVLDTVSKTAIKIFDRESSELDTVLSKKS